MKDRKTFTVLVADDEDEIRESVCELVPWRKLGFTLVGSAGNGLDALQLVEQLQPDLLLTDIRMPFISGTELAKQVRMVQPLIKVAFLSGYDDFEYARSAIDNGVISYLLKPISIAELSEALLEIHKKMEDSFDSILETGGEDSTCSSLAVSLLFDPETTRQTEREICRALCENGIDVSSPYDVMVVVTQVGHDVASSVHLTKIVEKVLKKYYTVISAGFGYRTISLIVLKKSDSEEYEALDELLSVIKRLVDPECTIGISSVYSKLSRSSIACKEAIAAERMADKGGLCFIGESEPDTELLKSDETEYIKKFESLMAGNSRMDLETYLRSTFCGQAKENSSLAVQTMISLLNFIRGTINAQGAAELLRRNRLVPLFPDSDFMDDIEDRVINLCLNCYDILNEASSDGVGYLCSRVLGIIERDFSNEELSLGTVSKELHISPNYLSANMKKYAGATFINLLIKRRMEEALRLLNAGEMKISEIARCCGYTDQHYFSYCFKKYYGMSPAQKRRGGGADE